MSKGQMAFTAAGFYLLTFGILYGLAHATFWWSVAGAIIFGPILLLIAMAQSTVIVANKK